jgi:hypothetical protein
MESSPDLLNMSSMTADCLMKLIACNAKLLGPVGDVGCHLGIDLFGIMRALGVIYMEGMGFMGFGCVVVLRHRVFPLFGSLRLL